VSPVVASIAGEYNEASLWQKQLQRLLEGLVDPRELHDTATPETDADYPVPEALEKIDMRSDAFAWVVKIEDGLPSTGRYRWEEKRVDVR
jgi:hypothetical protein